MTKSNLPPWIGATSAAIAPGSSAPSPSMNTKMSASSAAIARGQAGPAVAAAGVDHIGAGGAGARRRRIRAAAIGHDDAAYDVPRYRAHDLRDRGFLVERRDDQRNRPSLPSGGDAGLATRHLRHRWREHEITGSTASRSRNRRPAAGRTRVPCGRLDSGRRSRSRAAIAALRRQGCNSRSRAARTARCSTAVRVRWR